jgi:alpha-L-rhamnosidase
MLPADHPLRAARWIWPEAYLYLQNCHAQFRHDFDLPSVPAAAPLFITADKAYKLHVNGEFVCRGPARGYQRSWPFDEVDVAAFLRPGRNWLAVEAYNPGVGTFQYIHRNWAGLLAAARWENGFTLATEAAGWPCRRAPGRATATARYSLQLDFQEHADGRRDDRAWITQAGYAATPANGWDGGRVAPDAQWYTDVPFGRPPWEDAEPRGIPLLRETWRIPARVTTAAGGVAGGDAAARANIAWGWWAEMPPADAWRPASSLGRREDGWFTLELPAAGPGRFQAAVVELDEITVGNLDVVVEGGEGGEIVDFHHDLCLRDGRPRAHKPGFACSIALGNRLVLAGGVTRHEFFHLLAFRHVTVIARDTCRPLRLRLRVRAAGYPFAMGGAFACSDTTLNAIHAISRRTQQLCALDAYVDTPWREQAQWWGDARIQGRNTFHLDGDARLFARGIRSIAGQRTAQGLVHGHAPTTAHTCILPDFALTWLLTLRDHWWQTGETGLVRELWPVAQGVLSYFDTPEARHPCGLLRHDRRFWYFGDWADLYRGEIPAFLNLWYLLALRETARLLHAAGRRAAARHWRNRAAAHARLVVERLFDTDARLFRDGLDADLKPVARCSVHEQVLAIILGLVPEAEETLFGARVLPYLRGEPTEGARPSAFWSAHVLELAIERGHAADAVAFIRRHWEPMLSTGTTWEDFTWSETDSNTCCHAWTGHPSWLLVGALAGIRQTAPAWRRILLTPAFVAGIDHASAVVPAPPGPIRASWRRLAGGGVEVELHLPPGVTADVRLPGRPPRRVARPASRWLV